jgi:hypothetical protein
MTKDRWKLAWLLLGLWRNGDKSEVVRNEMVCKILLQKYT